ncbi:hypothetical protein OUZ56_010934 [Daphnia magna]|uniref:Uncharacterized protein n=1 Tax=Daphnia magna TaxID=35525 RepID=A0ABQ9YYY0_9CRUS|nr:hypothetical protein OUZ56_010934 [Daphnia magna]
MGSTKKNVPDGEIGLLDGKMGLVKPAHLLLIDNCHINFISHVSSVLLESETLCRLSHGFENEEVLVTDTCEKFKNRNLQ